MAMDWNVLAEGLQNFSKLMQGLLAEQVQTEREQKLYEKRLGLQTEAQKEMAKYTSGLQQAETERRLALEHDYRIKELEENFNLRTEDAWNQFFNWDKDFINKLKNYNSLPLEEKIKVNQYLELHQKLSAGQPLSKEEMTKLTKEKDHPFLVAKLTTMHANAINQQLEQTQKLLDINKTDQAIKQEKELFPLRKEEMSQQINYMKKLSEQMDRRFDMDTLNAFTMTAERLLSINEQRAGNLRTNMARALVQAAKAKRDDRKALLQEVQNWADELKKIQDINNTIYDELTSRIKSLSTILSLGMPQTTIDLSSISTSNPFTTSKNPAPITPRDELLLQTLPPNEAEALRWLIQEFTKK